MAKKKVSGKPLVMVGPGAEDDEELDQDLPEEEEDDEGSEDESGEADEEESERPKRKPKAKAKEEEEDEGGSSDEDDERVGHGEDDEEEDEDGKPKRESRKARRERQRRARQRNELELNFLRQRNDVLERKVNEIDSRVSKNESGSLEQRIGQLQGQLRVADQVLAKAHEDGTGEDIVEAQNIRDKIRDAVTKLTNYKTEVSNRSEEEEPTVDSRLIFHARDWMTENSWYDPNGTDKESRRVAAIDNRLVEEGFDPRSPDYWEELSRRVKRALPDRFRKTRDDDDGDDADDDDGESRRSNGKDKRGSGPRFSTGGRERPLRKNEVYVDPARKQALIDAGVWDDKVLRQKYLKRYAEYDREHPRGQRTAR